MMQDTTIGWGFDCIGENVQHLITAKPDAIWPYDSGSEGIAWTDSEMALFPGAHVYRVNQGFIKGPGQALHGDEFDFEAGAWTLDELLEIVAVRRSVRWSTRIYSTWSNYGLIKQMLAQAGTGGSVWFRIADWNLDQHLAGLELHGDVYAGQWASNISNPTTRVPGTDITLAEAGADLSVLLKEYTGWVS